MPITSGVKQLLLSREEDGPMLRFPAAACLACLLIAAPAMAGKTLGLGA